jgi:hypothetical protein
MAVLLKTAIGNNVSDTLSTSISAAASSIPVNAISRWGLGIGKIIVDRGLPTEEIYYSTGVSGSSLTVDTNATTYKEGTTQVGHDAGATIESVPTAGDWNDMITWGLVGHNDDGSHKGTAFVSPYYVQTYASTTTFDLDNGNKQVVTLTGNPTLLLANVISGTAFVIKLKQDATGSRTVTWFDTIHWPSNTVPTLTTTASHWDVFGFIQTATDVYDGFIVGQDFQ